MNRKEFAYLSNLFDLSNFQYNRTKYARETLSNMKVITT